MQHVHIVFAMISCLALLGGGTIAAAAQGLPGGASSLNEAHGDWSVACVAREGSVQCAISQSQVSGQNGQRVLTIELRAAEGGEAINGVLILPFGLRLDDGVTLAIDESAALPTQRFSTCLPAGCLVPLAFDAGTVSALRAGSALALTAAANDTGQEVSFSISLTGFTAALNRIAQLGVI